MSNGTVRTIEYLEQAFSHGQIPTQCDFWDLIATFSDRDWADFVPLSGFSLMTGPLSTNMLFASCGNSDQWCTAYSLVCANSAAWFNVGQFVPLSGYAVVTGPLTTQSIDLSGGSLINIGNSSLSFVSDAEITVDQNNIINLSTGLKTDGRITLQNQLYFNSDSNVSQLSSLSGNYDEGQFIGRTKLSQNNTRLFNIGEKWVARGDTQIWHDVSISSDGKYQTAVSATNGHIYISSDYGYTWIAKESAREWWGVSISSDGKYQTAVAYSGQIYISSDYGHTWIAKESDRTWRDIAISSDGKYQTAVVLDGQIYISSDYGHTWTAKESDRHWGQVAMSSDGKYQTAVAWNDRIYFSSDYGHTWTPTEFVGGWYGIAMSSDGKYQTVVADPGQIHISSDYGDTWSAKESIRRWIGIAMSSDGKYQTATSYDSSGELCVSLDYGNTWAIKDSFRDWRKVAMSSDGKYQTAVVFDGQIYTSKADEIIDGNLSVNGVVSSICGNSTQWCSAWSIVSGGIAQGDYVPLSGNAIITNPISTQQINVSGCVVADCITGLTSINLDGDGITSWNNISAYYDLAGMDILPGDLLHVEYSPSSYDIVTPAPGLSAYPLSGHLAGIDSALSCISGVSAITFTNTTVASTPAKTLTNYLLIKVNGSDMYLPLYT